MASDTLVVGIGRGTDTGELDAQSWADFKYAAQYVVTDLGGIIVFAGEGVGEWDGGTEVAFTMVVSLETIRDDKLRVKRTLEYIGRFSVLAAQYEQEAIALTFGSVVMATATADYETIVL